MFSFLNNCLQCCYSLTPEQWEILQQDIAVISQDYKSCKNYLISWYQARKTNIIITHRRERTVAIYTLTGNYSKQDTGRPLRFILTLLRDHLDQRQITLHHRNVGNQPSVLV